jgi:tRNA(adenine34) deaminase
MGIASIIKDDYYWMGEAIAQAKLAQQQGEVPVGAVLVANNECIASAFNQPISTNDPTAHAEMLVLREAAKQLNNYRLLDTTLYVTLEPCAMCAMAMVHARVGRLVYGAKEPRSGAAGSVFNLVHHEKLNHKIQWDDGIRAGECEQLLQDFFQIRRTE